MPEPSAEADEDVPTAVQPAPAPDVGPPPAPIPSVMRGRARAEPGPARAEPGPSQAEPGPAPPTAGHPPRGWAIAGGFLVAVIVIALGLLVGGVFASSTTSHGGSSVASKPPRSPTITITTSVTTTTPPTTSTASTTATAGNQTFTGDGFSIQYPASWTIQANQKQYSWGTDTTIVAPDSAKTLLRVDVTPHLKTTDPLTSSQSEITGVSKEPGYRQIGLTPNSVDGDPGERWEFLVLENGLLLHKVDQFIVTPQGTGIAVLTQSPAAQYGSLAGEFASLRKSLAIS